MRAGAGRAAPVLLAWVLAGCAAVAPPVSVQPAEAASTASPPAPAVAADALPALVPLERHAESAAETPESAVAPVVADTAGEPASGGEPPYGVEFERGGASWYGSRFQGRRTASGERFDMADRTAAHRTLPFGTLVCVRSLANDRQVLVRVNDNGPHARNRVIDLSQAAAEDLGMVGLGVQTVALSRPFPGQHRCE